MTRWRRHAATAFGTSHREHASTFGAAQALLPQTRAARARGHHRFVELPETDRGKFADEPGEIPEMMRRRRMRHAGLARHRAQRQPGKPVALQHPLGGFQERLVQVAMLIGRVVARAAPAPRRPRGDGPAARGGCCGTGCLVFPG